MLQSEIWSTFQRSDVAKYIGKIRSLKLLLF